MTAGPSDLYDVAVIGAGPAGLAAAEQLLKYGARVVLLDEQPRPGGQIMRQPPKDFQVKNWLKGAIYKDLKDLLRRMEDHPRITWKMPVTVSGVAPFEDADSERGFEIWAHDVAGNGKIWRVKARKVLISAGCHERPLTFPGATTPGVMGAGAIQTFLKSQQIIAGKHFVFAGAHPLQLIVAEQILEAGGRVEAVAFAQPALSILAALKTSALLLRQWRTFAAAARSLYRLWRAGVPLLFGYAVREVAGTDLMTGLTLQPVTRTGVVDARRPERHFTADRLGLCYGFQVSSELARQAGAGAFWSERRGGWLIAHDGWMQSSLPGLHVAGEITGMAGADASHQEGVLAGLGIALGLGLLAPDRADLEAHRPRKRLRQLNLFADFLTRLSHLPEHLAINLMTEDSLLCRCEGITCGSVERALAEHPHLQRADSVKLLTRTGMGLCQGRLCYANTAALIAHARNCSIEDVGPYHAQWPVKPVPITSLLEDKK